jgi:hypothetical protein
VIVMASQKKSHRGFDVTLVTIGHATVAMITPMTVSFP